MKHKFVFSRIQTVAEEEMGKICDAVHSERKRCILHCDLNSFYASVEIRNRPKLQGKAVAVCGSQAERSGIVLAKSEKAKKCGV